MTNEELCTRYQTGDAEALEELYKANRGLIEIIIRKYGAFADLDDLRQESFFAVRQAAALWDHTKGGNFATYCGYWIRQAANRYVFTNYGTIRAPGHTRAKIQRYNRVINAYRVEFGRDPSKDELAAVLGLTLQQLDDLKRDIITLHTRSASEPIGDEDGEDTLQDFLKDDRDPIGDLLDRIHREELREAIEKELDAIPEREAAIIRKRYFDGLTLKETGAAMGVTPERVRQLEARAFRALRRPSVEKRLSAYFTDSGAYSAGLRGTGLTTFRNSGTSSPEAAIIRLEEIAGRFWEKWGVTPPKLSYAAK